MTATTTTSIEDTVQSEVIEPVLFQASKDAAIVAQFAKEHDRTPPGMSPNTRLVREVSDVETESDRDELDQTEGTDIDATEWDTEDVEFGVSEYGIRRDLTDDAVEDGIFGEGLIQMLVNSGAGDLAIGFDDDVASLLGGFTTEVGTSGESCELDDLIEAVSELDDNNMHEGGGAVFVLGNQQKLDITLEAKGAQGTIIGQFIDLAGSNQGAPTNFVGTLLQYPIWFSTLTDTANEGADTTGALFIRGDEGRNERTAALATSTKRMPRPELERNSAGRATKIVVTMRRGSAENIDDSGVSIITSAD